MSISRSNSNLLPLVITSGEPAGIGPDILLSLANHSFKAPLVVLADRDLLAQRASLLNITQPFVENDSDAPLQLIHCPLPSNSQAGQTNPDHASYVIDMITQAVSGCQRQQYAGMITAPVHKAVINQAGIAFSGHTELIANLCEVKHVVMMLASPKCRVALQTTHIPLCQVSSTITTPAIVDTLRIIHHDLTTRFAMDAPRILVCGLNPHAGESGFLGQEDLATIKPAIEQARQQGWQITGPHSADTAFTPYSLEHCDAILAMYHDQGLTAIKALSFGDTVNITLGLPIIRTSVDHGTALDIAGTGQADNTSLLSAIRLTEQLCHYV